jgi:hypothetical protein
MIMVGWPGMCEILAVVYAAHAHNALRRFRPGDLWVASTSPHSDDDSVFDLVFPQATERELV